MSEETNRSETNAWGGARSGSGPKNKNRKRISLSLYATSEEESVITEVAKNEGFDKLGTYMNHLMYEKIKQHLLPEKASNEEDNDH